MHRQIAHEQVKPSQLVAQPGPFVATQGERAYALYELALRHDAVDSDAPQPHQQFTQRRPRHRRTGITGLSTPHDLHPLPKDASNTNVTR
ncbi:hypothetical protein GCM10010377_01340 [Streptomyces viridiviolaceus]|nr:hypothetical protein GCM10010377_01340 [Streptomyces viridiviolaceus]